MQQVVLPIKHLHNNNVIIQMNMKNKFSLSAGITGVFLLLSILFANAQTVFVVTNTTDNASPAPGSLRYAINQVNLNSGSSIIKFNIPIAGTSLIDITLVSFLPTISKTVTIDGTTQPGYSLANPRIRIVGVDPATATYPTGIVFSNASASKLLGLQILGFLKGVSIQSSNSCEIRNCYIYRCANRSVELSNSSYCIIKGNTLNTDNTGQDLHWFSSSANASNGIYITNNGSIGSSNNIIGGQVCGEGNTIAYTQVDAIDNNATAPASAALNVGNIISGNKIYGMSGVGIAINLRAAANGNLPAPTISSVSGCVVSGTTTTAFGIIELFNLESGAIDKKTTKYFLAATTANASGAWSVPTGVSLSDRVTATVRDPLTGNTSEVSVAANITQSSTLIVNPIPGGTEGAACLGQELAFHDSLRTNVCVPFLWDFGDGSPVTTTATHSYSISAYYHIIITATSTSGCSVFIVGSGAGITNIRCPPQPPCENCIGSFAPEPGHYLISAWVKAETANPLDTTYTTPSLEVSFPSSGLAVVPCTPSGRIIDGWQRIEGRFAVRVSNPPTMPITSIKIDLKCGSGTGNCLFDDIRIFPLDGSMKTYVYDPASKRLVAELDERNYTTFYEYDEEGKLVRVKKETERGIMTIKENRDNTNIR
jgi:parallel beta-helix repeat protein/YD repeat-containing protein